MKLLITFINRKGKEAQTVREGEIKEQILKDFKRELSYTPIILESTEIKKKEGLLWMVV